MFVSETVALLTRYPVPAAALLLGAALIAGLLNALNAWAHRHNPNEDAVPKGWWTETIFKRSDSDFAVFAKGMLAAPVVLIIALVAGIIVWGCMNKGTPLACAYVVALAALVVMNWLVLCMHGEHILGIFWWWKRRLP